MRHTPERQADTLPEITFQMIEAGFQVLSNSGIADCYLGEDKTLVDQIYLVMAAVKGDRQRDATSEGSEHD